MISKRFRQLACLTMAALLCMSMIPAHAESLNADIADDARIWTLIDESGNALTRRASAMYVDDEYIAGDNRLFRVISVDEAACTASAQFVGYESPANRGTISAFFETVAHAEGEDAAAKAENDDKRLICMYSTHSDESYIPEDGKSSKLENAGIYDVGNALKDNLEKLGIEVIYSEETFHPHDAGAYSRSRVVAQELLKKLPDALIDIHRDGIPKEEYETEVKGEDTSMVRLFVGRNNPNSAVNREFAKELKAVADEKYPGLIKDIFIGKGNYNQELYPNAILLEFGTHEIEKEKAMDSTKYMATVLNNVLYDGTAKAEGAANKAPEAQKKGSGVASGVIWTIVIAAIAAAAYAFLSTGSGKGAMNKMKRNFSEMTGGLMGKKPKDDDKQ